MGPRLTVLVFPLLTSLGSTGAIAADDQAPGSHLRHPRLNKTQPSGGQSGRGAWPAAGRGHAPEDGGVLGPQVLTSSTQNPSRRQPGNHPSPSPPLISVGQPF